MIDENKPQETICHFCAKTYLFTTDELKELYTVAKQKE